MVIIDYAQPAPSSRLPSEKPACLRMPVTEAAAFLYGRSVSGAARAAREAGAKVAVLAGQVLLPPEVYRQTGIEVALPCMTPSMPLDHALAHGEPLLAEAARRFADVHLR